MMRRTDASKRHEPRTGSPLWDNDVDGPGPRALSRTRLLRGLSRAAQLRAVITLLSFVANFILMAMVLSALQLDAKSIGQAPLILWVFGAPLIVDWICTVKLCRNFGRCPSCGGSLWSCGTGNFKPRRMRIRKDANGCPHCGLPFTR